MRLHTKIAHDAVQSSPAQADQVLAAAEAHHARKKRVTWSICCGRLNRYLGDERFQLALSVGLGMNIMGGDQFARSQGAAPANGTSASSAASAAGAEQPAPPPKPSPAAQPAKPAEVRILTGVQLGRPRRSPCMCSCLNLNHCSWSEAAMGGQGTELLFAPGPGGRSYACMQGGSNAH